LKIKTRYSEATNRRRTDDTMAKSYRDKHWSTILLTEN